MANIIELIDSLLPQDKLDIYYLELPQDKSGMLIEETGVNGTITSFSGYDGVISSRIQFYVRADKKTIKYKYMDMLIKDFYKVVQSNVGCEKDNIKLLYVGEFTYTPNIRDEKGNYIFSLIFPVIYKENKE